MKPAMSERCRCRPGRIWCLLDNLTRCRLGWLCERHEQRITRA